VPLLEPLPIGILFLFLMSASQNKSVQRAFRHRSPYRHSPSPRAYSASPGRQFPPFPYFLFFLRGSRRISIGAVCRASLCFRVRAQEIPLVWCSYLPCSRRSSPQIVNVLGLVPARSSLTRILTDTDFPLGLFSTSLWLRSSI